MCWLCKLLKKGPGEIVVHGVSSSRITTQTPTPEWQTGKLPTYKVTHLIKHLEYRISIHQSYWGLVEQDPASWSAFGSAEFHQWAIEGYQNAIYYLKEASDVQ